MRTGESNDEDLLMGSDIDEGIEDEDSPLDLDGDEKDDSDADDVLLLIENSDSDVPEKFIEHDGSDEEAHIVVGEDVERGGIGG
jgi:hypothetical protein